MSLFSHDEICKGCKHSMFAKNSYEAPIFWACKIGEETHVNGITGDCPAKEIEEEPKFMNDTEKEMNKIIKRTFFQGSQIDQETAASACYEIHRREMIKLLEEIATEKGFGYNTLKTKRVILGKLRILKG